MDDGTTPRSDAKFYLLVCRECGKWAFGGGLVRSASTEASSERIDTMDDLITFFSARLDEDEAAAKALAELNTGSPQWHADTDVGEYNIAIVADDSGWPIARCGIEGLQDGELNAAHIARHDPARVLREVAAKRARLAAFDQAIEEMDRLLADDDAEKIRQGVAIGRCEAAREAVKHDAAVYSDHPDYRAGWAPDVPLQF